MAYIPVPVPEEHVAEVMQTVARLIAKGKTEPWDQEGVAQLFLEADEPTRSVLSVVARYTLADKDAIDESVADRIQLTLRETMTIMRAANERAETAGRPPLLSHRRKADELPNGRTVERRVFLMDRTVAGFVRTAERAANEIESHPLREGLPKPE